MELSKLCFKHQVPWESAVAPDIEAQQYVLYDGVSDEIKKGNVTYWHGLKMTCYIAVSSLTMI